MFLQHKNPNNQSSCRIHWGLPLLLPALLYSKTFQAGCSSGDSQIPKSQAGCSLENGWAPKSLKLVTSTILDIFIW